MARVVKAEAYAVKRNEILDVAQRLVYTRGYERMSIQDILEDLHISKGAFYHYFDSKQAVLEAVIKRMIDTVEQLLIPIVADTHLSAVDKLERFFAASARWKITQKPFFMALLRIWYTDDNALVRQKVSATGIQRVNPLLAAIIRQGVAEGVFTPAYPDEVGHVILSIGYSVGDAVGELLLAFDPASDDFGRVERLVAAYTDAMERVLGAAPGSLTVVDTDMLKEWFFSSSDNG
jgi:AcrR family transcriptional regulator